MKALTLPALILPVLTAALIACGGGGPGDSAAQAPAAPPQAPLESPAADARFVLVKAQQAMASLSGMHVTLKSTSSQSGSTQTSTQELDVEGTTRAVADVTGLTPAPLLMAIDGTNVYMKVAGKGWQTSKEAFGLSFEDLGFDFWSASHQLAAATSAATKVERLADKTDGAETLYQVRASGTAEAYFRQFVAASGGKGPLALTATLVKGGTFEATYLIDKDNRLRFVTVGLKYSVGTLEVAGSSEATFSAFNQPIRFPADFPRP